MSLLLVRHVAVGGLAGHAALVNIGNVSVPTAPLGADAPAQLLEFDQPALPGGALPVHVKSACARACVGSAKPHAATIRAMRSTRRLLRPLRQLRREADRLAARLPGELRGAGRALRLDRGGEPLGHFFLAVLGEDRGLTAERDLALADLRSPYTRAVGELGGALAGLGSKAEVAHVHVRVALVAVDHDRDVVVRCPGLRVLVVPARVRTEAISHHNGRYRKSRRQSSGGEGTSTHHNLPESMPARSSQSGGRRATVGHESSLRFRQAWPHLPPTAPPV